jgi:hypothetical protein
MKLFKRTAILGLIMLMTASMAEAKMKHKKHGAGKAKTHKAKRHHQAKHEAKKVAPIEAPAPTPADPAVEAPPAPN